MVVLIVIILTLLGINVFLSLLILLWTKKYKFFEKKDKEFIVFVIDMYIKYAKELDIHSEEQHEQIVKHLEKIKNKYFLDENKNSFLKK